MKLSFRTYKNKPAIIQAAIGILTLGLFSFGGYRYYTLGKEFEEAKTDFASTTRAFETKVGELEMALEDEFEGLEIDVEAASINNVGQLVDYIITNIKEVPA